MVKGHWSPWGCTPGTAHERACIPSFTFQSSFWSLLQGGQCMHHFLQLSLCSLCWRIHTLNGSMLSQRPLWPPLPPPLPSHQVQLSFVCVLIVGPLPSHSIMSLPQQREKGWPQRSQHAWFSALCCCKLYFSNLTESTTTLLHSIYSSAFLFNFTRFMCTKINKQADK